MAKACVLGYMLLWAKEERETEGEREGRREGEDGWMVVASSYELRSSEGGRAKPGIKLLMAAFPPVPLMGPPPTFHLA